MLRSDFTSEKRAQPGFAVSLLDLLSKNSPTPLHPGLLSSGVSSYFKTLKKNVPNASRARGPLELEEQGTRASLEPSRAQLCSARRTEISLLFLPEALYHSFFLLGRASSPARPQDTKRHSLGRKAESPLPLSVQFMARSARGAGGMGKGLGNNLEVATSRRRHTGRERSGCGWRREGGRERPSAGKEGRRTGKGGGEGRLRFAFLSPPPLRCQAGGDLQFCRRERTACSCVKQATAGTGDPVL